MVNGQLSEATVFVLGGVFGLLILAGIVLGVVIQLKKLRADAATERTSEIEKAKKLQEKETKSEVAFQVLTKSVDALRMSVEEMKGDVKQRIETIECTRTDHSERLARVESVANSAHKRIDEHRKLDHQIADREAGHG